jgi:hypothetical protein
MVRMSPHQVGAAGAFKPLYLLKLDRCSIIVLVMHRDWWTERRPAGVEVHGVFRGQ